MKWFFLIFGVWNLVVISQPKSMNLTSSCEFAKKTYRDAGYKDEDIFTTEQEGSLLECGLKRTCCMKKAEENLLSSSEKARTGLSNPLHKLKDMFQGKRVEFKDNYQIMMNVSQSNLHSMFENTYKSHYTNNAYIIDDLYKSLRQYINGGELDLRVKFNTFFGNLHEKVYVMVNPGKTFDAKYRNCIRDNTNSVKPFGDKQNTISTQMTRAFEASRVFLQGLKEGMDVSLKLLDSPVHEKCKVAFMKMSKCSICYGLNPNGKPCANYCLNVMKGCYAYTMMFQPRWNTYIHAMTELVAKLKGPFNMEVFVVPLGVQISGAIMTFQENIQNVTRKVEAVCGQPAANTNFLNGDANSRSRRDTAAADQAKKSLDRLKVSSEQVVSSGTDFQKQTQAIIDSLKNDRFIPRFMMGKEEDIKATAYEKLLAETKKKLRDLEDYWYILPNQICSAGIASPNNTNCWNGQNTNGYTKPVVKGNLKDLFNSNPEMDLTSKSKEYDSGVLTLDAKLQDIIKQIDSVMGGNGIVQPDTEASGSGSGDDSSGDNDNEGSGERPATTEEPEEGSAIGSGDGKNDGGENKTKPPVRVTTESNSVVTDAPTIPTCHPNDANCLPDENSIGPNGVNAAAPPEIPPWQSRNKQTQDNPSNASTTLTTNFSFISTLAVLIVYWIW